MRESTQITLLIIGLLIIGGAYTYTSFYLHDFTFSSAKLTVNNNFISESLEYSPNDAYHTLYRTFITPIYHNSSTPMRRSGDFIYVSGVQCSAGTLYIDDFTGVLQSNPGVYSLENTEPNEYGCSFGSTTGFTTGNRYTVSADFILYPSTLYRMDGLYYIRFVAYSGGAHPLLINGKNLFADGTKRAGFILPNADVIIYVPFTTANPSQYNIIDVNSLSYGDNTWIIIITLLIALGPAIFCLIVWQIFGKEKSEGDYPSELSQYPKERKAWEVSAYFHPPFGDLDKNFLPTMVLDFFHRKMIDIQIRKTGLLIKTDEVFIKILKAEDEGLDDVEKNVLGFLRKMQGLDSHDDMYFSIKKAASGFSAGTAKIDFDILKSAVKKKSKEHLDYTGVNVLYGILVLFALCIYLGSFNIFIVIYAVVIGYVMHKSTLFIRFKDDYYLEFQQWQSFRKYLSESDSMKRSPPQGVVIWDRYLVYATALGVGKKVLDTMKSMKVLDERSFNNYALLYTATSFGSFSSGSGAGGGGMGGGGIGGGGGGGR